MTTSVTHSHYNALQQKAQPDIENALPTDVVR